MKETCRAVSVEADGPAVGGGLTRASECDVAARNSLRVLCVIQSCSTSSGVEGRRVTDDGTFSDVSGCAAIASARLLRRL